MRALLRLAASLAGCGALVCLSQASAFELVQNGGFEEPDLRAWRIQSLSYERVAAPDAREGAYVLRVAVDPSKGDPQWVAQQVLPHVTPGAAYEFGAALAVVGGTSDARVVIEWMDRDQGYGNSLQTSVTPPTTSADGVFQVVMSRATAPSGARSALVRIEVRYPSSQTQVRIDAVTVDGPAPASPTPTSTLTAVPSETPSATSTASVTPSSTMTPTPGPGYELRNPGFEEAVDGVPAAWQKYGGELATTTRSHSGQRAGLLRSATDATKWAYQTVLVDGGSWYEFDAWILSDDPAVARALLRVSWYASADGSGTALASADSTGALTSSDHVYRHLTTGPVQAPPDARSARPRILLAPVGAGAASIALDDADWRPAAPPTATPTLTVTAAPTAEPSPEATSTPTATVRRSTGGMPRSEVRAATAAPAERSPLAADRAEGLPALSAPRATPSSVVEGRTSGGGWSWWRWTAGAAVGASVAAAVSVVTIRRRRLS